MSDKKAGWKMGTTNRRQGWLGRFLKGNDGSVTVEFVLWLPLFLALILVTADASLAFTRQSNFWTVSRDTARIVSRHGLDTGEAQRYAQRQARFSGYTPDVSVRVDPIASTVTVTITGDAKKLAPFGVLGLALGSTVSAQVTQTLEPI